MKKCISIFTLCLFMCVECRTQSDSSKYNNAKIYLQQFPVLQNSGVKWVLSLLVDRRGVLWIGTENGLFSFDGRHVTYLNHVVNDTSTLPGKYINSIAEDNQGYIWVGTNDGVAKINPNNNKAQAFTQLSGNINFDFDNNLFIEEGRIWAFNARGISLYDSNQQKFVAVWPGFHPNKSGYVTALENLDKEHLIAGTFEDLVIIDKKGYSFKRIALDKDNPQRKILVKKIYRDYQGVVWIATWMDGLFRYDPNTSRVLNTGLNSRSVILDLKATQENGKKVLWLATEIGLIKCPLTSDIEINWKEKSLFQHDPSAENSLTEGHVHALFTQGNQVWVGAKYVQRFQAASQYYKTIALSSGEVQDIQKIKWQGVDYYVVSKVHGDAGLVFFDSQMRLVRKIREFPFEHSASVYDIGNVAVDKFERLWISSFAGLFVVDQHFNLLHRFDTRTSDTLSSIRTNNVFIYNDTVWVACYKKGIDLFDLNFRKLKHFDEANSALSDGLVWRFVSDSKNRLWLCGNEFLFLYNPTTKNFKKFLLTTENRGCRPTDLAETGNGHLFVASQYGLIDFDPDNNRFFYLQDPVLSREPVVNSVCADDQGNLWFLTNEHLVNYDFKRKEYNRFGKEEGLASDQQNYLVRFFKNGFLLSIEDRLLFFSKDILSHQHDFPRIMITRIQVNDSTVMAPQRLSKLDLDYRQNKLLFEFSDLSFEKEQQTVFAFKLDGIDTVWDYTPLDVVSYASVPPGHYRFQVKAKNFAGLWSQPCSISIIIRPPFWKTAWFLTLAVLFLISVLVLFVRFISQRRLRTKIRLLEKEQAVEKERNRIAQGLHDDIGSSLSSISIMSDLALREQGNAPSAKMVREIRETSLLLMEKIDDLVWSINPRNDSLSSLLLRIKQIAGLLFEIKEIDYYFLIPDDIESITLPVDYRQHIYLILKEAINNIVKYSKASRASIEVRLQENILDVNIRDNGVGFQPLDSMRGDGLYNMKSRAALMNSTLHIDARQGQGTIIGFRVKIK